MGAISVWQVKAVCVLLFLFLFLFFSMNNGCRKLVLAKLDPDQSLPVSEAAGEFTPKVQCILVEISVD